MSEAAPAQVCPHLSTPPSSGHFRMQVAGAARLNCWRCAARNRRMLRRSILTSAVVGTILTLINQGPMLFDGDFPSALAWKVPLTYCVPFLVTTWGALGNAYSRGEERSE